MNDFGHRMLNRFHRGLLAISGGRIGSTLGSMPVVELHTVGREVQYRVIGSQLSTTARRLDAIGAEWDRRLAAIKQIAEGL